MTTLILLNPMGTDVTNFVNKTPFVPQLMRGTLLQPGDTVYTVPYSNTSGINNVLHGVDLLDTALHTITGKKLVFAYSEGGQIADMWLNQQGQSTPIDPADVSFLSIANANSKHCGFAYNQPVFNTVGYTQGQSASPYTYTIFTRQYDGVADFPTDPTIQEALAGLQGTLVNPSSLGSWASAAASVIRLIYSYARVEQLAAAENAAVGMALIHNYYFDVTLNDPQNVSYTDPANNVKYVWSPTYPVPALGTAYTNPARDRTLRMEIESCYQRPAFMPTPNYGSYLWGQMGWMLNGAPIAGESNPALF